MANRRKRREEVRTGKETVKLRTEKTIRQGRRGGNPEE